MSSEQLFCVNHPNTPTLLRCNRCGKPVCQRCVVKTPVGYRCKDCLHLQQSLYYNAEPLDYVLAVIVGLAVSVFAGAIMSFIGGFYLVALFAGPIAGGIIAEAVRIALRKHRGRYVWLIGCGAVILGGILGAALFPLLGRLDLIAAHPAAFVEFLLTPLRLLFNIGFMIYLALAVLTVYGRLRA